MEEGAWLVWLRWTLLQKPPRNPANSFMRSCAFATLVRIFRQTGLQHDPMSEAKAAELRYRRRFIFKMADTGLPDVS
jgi:hypothetical protein